VPDDAFVGVPRAGLQSAARDMQIGHGPQDLLAEGGRWSWIRVAFA
jgi:hypothetical protein